MALMRERRLAFALDAGSAGVWDWDLATGETWFSDVWMTMLGYEPGELPYHFSTWDRLVHPDDRDEAIALVTAHLEGRSAFYECEHRVRRKDGGWGWVLARGRVAERGPDGAAGRLVGTHVDVSARKEAEFRIEHMAHHDPLTDLPNRTLFTSRLDAVLARSADSGDPCAVMCLDLDRFKAVNDAYGHLVGDAVLGSLARRMRALLRPEDVLARLGGDEFGVLVADASDPDRVSLLAGALIRVAGEPVQAGDTQAQVGLSVGIAMAPEHGTDAETVFRRADLALYCAKSGGRNAWRTFDAGLERVAERQARLERDLRKALATGELRLHYQPQVEGLTGRLAGFEALVRWEHPERGLLPPAEFIGLAEDSGLIHQLGEWAIRKACMDARSWAPHLKVAVNVSPRQFQNAELAESVLSILVETGFGPGRLELEVTESVIVNDVSRALGILRRLKDYGVAIVMDDFGTGYSSLATLQAFPFDKIKIDRGFVGQIETNPQAAVITRTILGLGRNLGIGVIAEGVETIEQLRFLQAEGCAELQGFLFGRASPADEISHLVGPSGAIIEPKPEIDLSAGGIAAARRRPTRRMAPGSPFAGMPVPIAVLPR